MFATFIRTVQVGLFVAMGLFLSGTVHARPFQAGITINAQTRDITVTKLLSDSKITNELPLNTKTPALLSPPDNLRAATLLLGADWKPVSASNYDIFFQVSLDDTGFAGNNQQPVSSDNMTHILWGVTYCADRYGSTPTPPSIVDKSIDKNQAISPALSLLSNEIWHPLGSLLATEIHQEKQLTGCLNRYIIQCPITNDQKPGTYATGIFLENQNEGIQNIIAYLQPSNNDEDDDGAGGGWDSGHTFNPDDRIYCPACDHFGCRSIPQWH